MPFIFKQLNIPDVVLIIPVVFNDDRGFFFESFKESVFSKNGLNIKFVQENHSLSKKSVIRGLHYQIEPMSQGKLVRVISGRVFDVAVDLRRNSPTYLKYVSSELSADNKQMLWIPEGFAHGFCSLEDNSELVYKTTNEYSPEHERGIKWNDPTINIKWPINNPIISKKDKELPFIY